MNHQLSVHRRALYFLTHVLSNLAPCGFCFALRLTLARLVEQVFYKVLLDLCLDPILKSLLHLYRCVEVKLHDYVAFLGLQFSLLRDELLIRRKTTGGRGLASELYHKLLRSSSSLLIPAERSPNYFRSWVHLSVVVTCTGVLGRIIKVLAVGGRSFAEVQITLRFYTMAGEDTL